MDIEKVLREKGINEKVIKDLLPILEKIEFSELELREVFNMLGTYNITSQTVEGSLVEVLSIKPELLKQRLKAVKKHKISDEAINRCFSLIIRKDATNMSRVLSILEKAEIKTKVEEEGLPIFISSQSSDVSNTLKILKKNNIDPKEIKCGLPVLVSLKETSVESIVRNARELSQAMDELIRCQEGEDIDIHSALWVIGKYLPEDGENKKTYDSKVMLGDTIKELAEIILQKKNGQKGEGSEQIEK